MMGLFSTLHAQNTMSITVSAMVIDNAAIEMIIMNHMYVDATQAVNGIVTISPLYDANAGKLLIKGRPGASMNVTFLSQPQLVNKSRDGSLSYNYTVSGYSSDNQQASRLLDTLDYILKFNDQGEYYLWVGGQADISNAQPGNYEGEFTFEIEYQ